MQFGIEEMPFIFYIVTTRYFVVHLLNKRLLGFRIWLSLTLMLFAQKAVCPSCIPMATNYIKLNLSWIYVFTIRIS